MRSYACFVENFEERGLFVGCLLNAHDKGLDRIRKSETFRHFLEAQYSEFSSLYEYNIDSLEKYFGRCV